MTITDTDKRCLGDVPLSLRGTVSEQIKKLTDGGGGGKVGAHCRQKSEEMFKSHHVI